jgi:HTH-type transcriptional regulator / antitoxin HigA
MNWTIIRNEKDYQRALKRLEAIFDAKQGTKESDEVELLALLIEHYENIYYPIGEPDPIDAIRFRLDQMGYRQADLVKILGSKSRVSEILNRKRKLTLEMMRKINEVLGVPMDTLVKDYKLKTKSSVSRNKKPKTTAAQVRTKPIRNIKGTSMQQKALR